MNSVWGWIQQKRPENCSDWPSFGQGLSATRAGKCLVGLPAGIWRTEGEPGPLNHLKVLLCGKGHLLRRFSVLSTVPEEEAINFHRTVK